MSRIDWAKNERDGNNHIYKNTLNDGSAARTRPFSFEEIMHKRQNKKQTADAEVQEYRVLSNKQNTEGGHHVSQFDQSYKHGREYNAHLHKHTSEDTAQDISRKKKDSRIKEDNFSKSKLRHNAEIKLKPKFNKEKRSIERGDRAKLSQQKNQKGRHPAHDSAHEYDRRRAKDMTTSREHYSERERTLQRERKRKFPPGETEKIRSDMRGIFPNNHDSNRWPGIDYRGRKMSRKESSRFHHEEGNIKRWKSGSKGEDRDESVSPRASEHLAHHSSRSVKQPADVERNRLSMPSNGDHPGRQHKRHGRHSSGLGGYSPRKRRTDAAVKTPSPTIRSPEKKSAAWDLPPTGQENEGVDSVMTNFHKLAQVGISGSTLVPSVSQCELLFAASKRTSVDAVQLTQATRPLRRLYAENIPDLATDKALMEHINNFLLSSGVNHIKGTKPCISCIINKEKGQAVLEFLTPEDATSALAFDGKSFSGSVIKIRRPKDFVETKGLPEKPLPKVAAISDVVKDSPHKIFIGGISKALSSEMLMEIVSAFGILKAWHFEVKEEFDEPIAFVEYADQSISLKACAGLNGLKLGGKILTAVKACPNASGEDITDLAPFYGIPEHAEPLLAEPTQILKLKDMFTHDELSLLGESELAECLEDVRLECARFGTVKSVNIVNYASNHLAGDSAVDNIAGSSFGRHSPGCDTADAITVNSTYTVKGNEEVRSPQEIRVDSNVGSQNPICSHVGDEARKNDHEAVEVSDDQSPGSNEVTDLDTGGRDQNLENVRSQDIILNEADDNGNEDFGGVRHGCADLTLLEGCILVEFLRKESACLAAHSLHGRLYADRIVSAGYMSYELYKVRFCQ